MNTIASNSKRIEDITSVINSIAFQTNILALNAAVEAARAGTQGRGFAVVASEVRTLAQKSAVAAKDIESLIAQSVSSVKNGAELVNRSGEVIDSIISSVNKVHMLMEQISVASEEQSRGIGQVGQAVTEMDGVTQQNAALVQQLPPPRPRWRSRRSSCPKVSRALVCLLRRDVQRGSRGSLFDVCIQPLHNLLQPILLSIQRRYHINFLFPRQYFCFSSVYLIRDHNHST